MPHSFLDVGTCEAFPHIGPGNGRELLNVPDDVSTNKRDVEPLLKAIRTSLPTLQHGEKAKKETRKLSHSAARTSSCRVWVMNG